MRLWHLEGIEENQDGGTDSTRWGAASRDWLLWTPKVTEGSDVARGSRGEECG